MKESFTIHVIDLRGLTSVEQESIVNDLFVNGQRVWDYDRHRSWNEPRATKRDIEIAGQVIRDINIEKKYGPLV